MTVFRWQVIGCALLCLACGIVDAVGYIHHGIFAANMTGNTVLLGLDLAHGDWSKAAERTMPLVLFFLGAVAARLLLLGSRQPQGLGLLLESLLIVAAALLAPSSTASLLLIAFAMGMQAAAMTSFGGIAVSTVVVTSTLARIGEALADRMLGSAYTDAPRARSVGLYGLTWTCYLAGASASGLAAGYPRSATAVSAGLVGMAALSVVIAHGTRPAPDGAADGRPHEGPNGRPDGGP